MTSKDHCFILISKKYQCYYLLYPRSDGVVMMTKSETSDCTSTPTVDQNTDSRHESVALMEEKQKDESLSRESSVTSAIVSDKNSPQKEQEFAVPTLPSLTRGKNRTSKTILTEEKIVEDKETNIKEKTKDSAKTDEDKKDEKKRVGSSVSADVKAEDLNEKPEENVSINSYMLLVHYMYLTLTACRCYGSKLSLVNFDLT